jgi:hypothetical protein
MPLDDAILIAIFASEPLSPSGTPAALPARHTRRQAATAPQSLPPPSAPRPALPPIAARPAPRPLQLPTTVAPAPHRLRAPRPHLVVEEEDPDVLFTPVGVVPLRRASSARRCCPAHRRCPAITEPAIPTAMTAPITAARPMVPIGTVCRMLAACTDIAKRALDNNGDGRPTWQGHRGEPARRALPMRPRRISSPSWSP